MLSVRLSRYFESGSAESIYPVGDSPDAGWPDSSGITDEGVCVSPPGAVFEDAEYLLSDSVVFAASSVFAVAPIPEGMIVKAVSSTHTAKKQDNSLFILTSLILR